MASKYVQFRNDDKLQTLFTASDPKPLPQTTHDCSSTKTRGKNKHTHTRKHINVSFFLSDRPVDLTTQYNQTGEGPQESPTFEILDSRYSQS